jgi:hypothetical protein
VIVDTVLENLVVDIGNAHVVVKTRGRPMARGGDGSTPPVLNLHIRGFSIDTADMVSCCFFNEHFVALAFSYCCFDRFFNMKKDWRKTTVSEVLKARRAASSKILAVRKVHVSWCCLKCSFLKTLLLLKQLLL